MKFKRNTKYNTIAVYSCVTAFIVIVIISALINFGAVREGYDFIISVLSPVIWGFCFAYLFYPVYKYFREHVFAFTEKKKAHPKLRMALAIICTYICILLFLTVFILFIVPQVIVSYNDLQTRVGFYYTSLQDWLTERSQSSSIFAEQYGQLLEYLNISKISGAITSFFSDSYDIILDGTSYVFGLLGNLFTQVKNIAFGLVMSVYFILNKERLTATSKKILHAVLNESTVRRTLDIIAKTDRTFGGFIVGKLIDSLIIGILTFIVLGILNIPYYPLVSVIIGITNVIPFFGPFIGAIPSTFFIFVADPGKALWFILIIIIIQLIDGNIIGPRILGDTTGLDALWVIIAIIVMSGLLGVAGMFIGVPVFAVLYALVKESMEARLARKGLQVETAAYYENSDTVAEDESVTDADASDADASDADASDADASDTERDIPPEANVDFNDGKGGDGGEA